jgi:hypothetical protein
VNEDHFSVCQSVCTFTCTLRLYLLGLILAQILPYTIFTFFIIILHGLCPEIILAFNNYKSHF